jgi:hypothetical protein
LAGEGGCLVSKNSPSKQARRRAWADRQVQRKREAAARVPLPTGLAAALNDGQQRAKLGRRAAAWVTGYRQRHGYGPTWAELAEVLHPDCRQVCAAGDDDPYAVVAGHTHQVVGRLRGTRWLSASRRRRSLDIGARLANKRSQLEQAARIHQARQAADSNAAAEDRVGQPYPITKAQPQLSRQ